MSWLRTLIGADDPEGWRGYARESIVDVNDGIVAAVGVAEGFARAGATTHTLLTAGVVVMVAGAPEAELVELAGIYEAKGLGSVLARQVADALTEHDPFAAHADAELRLDAFSSPRASVYAALTAGLCFALGAALPLAEIVAMPVGQRVEFTFVAVLLALALTGWFASWLTGLPLFRVALGNLLLGAVTMAAGVIIGLVVGI